MTASSSFPPARTLIVYFSFTGNTETVARLLQKHTGATLMALERPADYLLGLDDDEDGPEPLEPDQVNLSDYDLVFLGFPIWTSQRRPWKAGWASTRLPATPLPLSAPTAVPAPARPSTPCARSAPTPDCCPRWPCWVVSKKMACSTRWKTSSWPRLNDSFRPGPIP